VQEATTCLDTAIYFETVSDSDALRRLKPEWDDLWRRSRAGRIAQSFEYCSAVWQTTARLDDCKPFCIVGRTQGRLISVWPLLTYRKLMRRFLRPLGATGAEYTDILIDDDIDGRACAEALWNFARSNCKADLIVLPFVPSGTHLNRILDSSISAAAVEQDVTFLTDVQGESNWESYYNSLSKSHRNKHRNLRKRLAELGELHFEVVWAGDPRCQKLVQWMLEQKRIWAGRTGKRGKWLYSEEYRDLLVHLTRDSDAQPKRVIMSLTLDGEPIAVKIGAISKNLFELLIAGFDARLDKFSPGTRLDEYWVRWAIEQELRIDFGVGSEHYKRFWTRDNEVRVNSYLVPNSLMGLVELKARRLKAVPRHAKGATHN